MNLGTQPWEEEAVCRKLHPTLGQRLFFPGSGPKTKYGIAMCQFQCPVREECLQFALDNEMDYGIWGGETAKTRMRMRGITE